MKNILIALLFAFFFILEACRDAGPPEDARSGDSDSDGKGDVDTDTDSSPEGDTDADADGDTDFGSDMDSDTDADSDADADTDSDSDTDSDADADTDSDTDSDTDTDADTDTDTDTDIDTDTDADTDRGDVDVATPPCDVFEAAGYPCVSAHSSVRILRAGYTGPLYQLCRGETQPGPSSCLGETLDIGAIKRGYADAALHTDFCTGQVCTITKLYDQAEHTSGPQNDLEPAPPGGAKPTPGNPVNATELPITINGHEAYGMLFRPGMGYRAGCNGCNTPIGTDLAVDDEPQTIYMITSALDTQNGCCFDYGNAETTCNNDGNGTIEAVFFGHGVIWGTGIGEGPWVMADLEDGLYAGWENGQDQGISTNTSLQHDFVTAIVVGDTADKNDGKGRFALYGGDATAGVLEEKYDGIRPEKPGYVPMRKQGSLILGISGDNSDGDGGRFYEGAIVNTPSDRSTLDDLQAAIVAAGYGIAVADSDADADTDTDADADTDTDADCTDVPPCGGDVIGTWNVTSSCLTVSGVVDISPLGLGCGSAPITGALSVTGTWTANVDGTYTDDTTTSGTESMELSSDCLSISGTRTTCSRIGGPLSSFGFAVVTCIDNPDTGGCTCQGTIEQTGGIGVVPAFPVVTGTYTTADGTLTVTDGEQEYSYCVSGTTLTMTPVSTDMTGTVTGSVELQRQ